MLRTVIYIGDDAQLLSELSGPLRCQGYELQQASLPRVCIEDLLAKWFRVLILDADVTTSAGLDFLRRVKVHDAGVPVIALGDAREQPLTTIGVARQNGCERWLCRSKLDAAELGKAIGDAFRRLEYWKASLGGAAERLRTDGCSDALL